MSIVLERRDRRVDGIASACALAASCALIASCSSGGGAGAAPSAAVGSLALDPSTGMHFVVSAHDGGAATSLHVRGTAWGRLVDVYDFDANQNTSHLIARDFVIDPTVISDGATLRLESNPFLERETLTILAPLGSAQFASLLAQLDTGVQSVLGKGLDPSELPPFTAVPRNAVLVVAFDDLLADGGHPGDPEYPGTVSPHTVRVATGYPPVDAFEARVLPDPCHGDVIDGRFHSTRVIIDPSISSTEALATGLEVNTLGFPSAASTAQPNVCVRIATHIAPQAQQFEVLANLAGHALAFTGNGPSDGATPSLDVVRVCRSGGATSVTGDLDNGFLVDPIAPELLLTQPVDVLSMTPLNADELALDVQFATPACACAPRHGDVIELATGLVEVVEDYDDILSGGLVSALRVRAVSNAAALAPGGGEFKTRWSAALGVPPECAVRFSPPPSSPPATGVPVDAQVLLAFSEPLDPSTVSALDSFAIAYDVPPLASPVYERVVGRVVSSVDRRRFGFQPALPLRHVAGEATGYTLHLGHVTDLAGNAAAIALPPIHFTLAPSAAPIDSGSIALTFASGDEDGDGAPELRGQFLHDFARGVVKPRPVARFSAVADTSVPIVGAMGTPAPPRPIQTPLSNHGSRAMLLWRYCDFGFGLLDESTHNLDLESLSWMPFSGHLQLDHFARFEMAAAHSKRAPDEATAAGLPMFPDSGLLPTFDDNLLEPLTVLHPSARGYTIQPSDTFVTATGTTMAPWPLNRDVDASSFTYWTWRDTAKLAVAGPNGVGVDPQRLQQVTKVADVGFYPVDQVPTIGLPLLMDFRTKPDVAATGQNGFRIAIALGSSANPFFRSFSTGYAPCSGPVHDIDPDTQITAAGGYDPVACATTQGQDDAFYFAQADFVVRVSRAHTIWFDTQGASSFSQAVIEPSPDGGPSGTQVVLAFRGASAITGSTTGWHDASNYDAYGDGFTAPQLVVFNKPGTLAFTPLFVGGKSWKSSPIQLQGSRFVQARISFLSNPVSQLSPELSAFGLAFQR